MSQRHEALWRTAMDIRGMRERIRTEALRLLGLAVDRLGRAHADLIRLGLTRADSDVVKTTLIDLNFAVALLNDAYSPNHRHVLQDLRQAQASLQPIEHTDVRGAWSDLTEATSLIEDDQQH
jgi:hypothetical protein